MTKERYTTIINAPRPLYVIADGDTVVHIGCKPPAVGLPRQDRLPVLADAAAEFTAYFDGKRQQLSFPIPTDHPPFIKTVYALISDIPYGETRRVDELISALGDPAAEKAVRMLCRFTPLPVRIPVHRVTGVYTHENIDSFGAALRQMEKRYS